MAQFIPINLNIRIKQAINALPESERERLAPKIRRQMTAEYNREQREKTRSEMAQKRRKWLFQEELAKALKIEAQRAITRFVDEKGIEQGENLNEVLAVFDSKLLQAVNKFLRG